RRRSDLAPAPTPGGEGPAPGRPAPPTRPRSPMPAVGGGRRCSPEEGSRTSAGPRAPRRLSFPTARSRELLAAERAGAVEPVHRPFNPRLQGELERSRDTVDDRRQAG